MFCSNCGNKMNENEQFCSICGAKINAGSSQNNTNMVSKKKNNIPLFLSIGCGCFSVILVIIIMFGVMLTGIFEDMKEEDTQKEVLGSEKFIGSWNVYNNGDVSENNYFIFNSDGTYYWKAAAYGEYYGIYDYSLGVTNASQKNKYFTDSSILYTFTLKPITLTKVDGTVVSDNLKESIYAIAISLDGSTMEALNLASYNTTILKKK